MCLRAHWGTNLAHNSPISAILPTIYQTCDRTVVLKAIDFAHAHKYGIFKVFMFTFLNSQDAQNFFRVYAFVAPEPEPEPESEIFIDLDALDIDSPKGDSKTKAEDEGLFIQGDDGSDEESEDGEGFLIQGDDGSDEEYIFQCTQEDHWAQAPSMPWGNNAY